MEAVWVFHPCCPYAQLPKAPEGPDSAKGPVLRALRILYGILTTLPRRSLTEYSDTRAMDSVYLGVIRSGEDRKGPQLEDFPVYRKGPKAWLFYNGLPMGESSTAS